MAVSQTQRMILTGIGAGILIGVVIGGLGGYLGLSAGVRGGLTGALTVVALTYLQKQWKQSQSAQASDQS